MADIAVEVDKKDANGQHPPLDILPQVPAVNGGQRKQQTLKCADFEVGAPDGAGRVVHDVYFKRDTYVIYCTRIDNPNNKDANSESQVRVRYADDPAVADKQIAEVAEIILLRNKLQFLLANMRHNKDAYYAQIAEAFRLGMEHKPEVAKQTLEAAIVEVQNIRASEGRNLYVTKAWPYAAVGAAILFVVAAAFLFFGIGRSSFEQASSSLAHLTMASGAGALGALLSIAISVRARTIATDGDDASIRNDALLRVMIGVISAGALYLIMATGVLAQVKIGELSFQANALSWKLVALVGFASGFLERMVPDMLEKKVK